ncbi:putative tRNA-splicing endonuclease subunit tsp-1 [Erysiphe neolycopersici]|uniref:Putative tRNA-splicing endonuclease subunit tsp-1 n=1 Tax=Erysiphe neolycopersici TaxID=212602 RepID=A0A420I2V6_9PEZI|nr:putative tRNA-splicing endonuclease subunit tsp-1 [Erysiphe neolycopersici]
MQPSVEKICSPSALQELFDTTRTVSTSNSHLYNLARQIQHNLEFQHAWCEMMTHDNSPITHNKLPRPLIAGLPPKRLYIHPDEQIELLKHEKGEISSHPEMEWVLPTHVTENWSLQALAEIFDAIGTVPPLSSHLIDQNIDKEVGWQWRGPHRQKRLLLATLHDDSTVVYYIVHDGIVKPRQN